MPNTSGITRYLGLFLGVDFQLTLLCSYLDKPNLKRRLDLITKSSPLKRNST